MRRSGLLPWLLVLLLAAPLAAQNPAAAPTNAPPAIPPTEVERLAQSNRDLLDLLKKQQGVLQDIQYDRRLQNRQIQQLEEQLTDALHQNADLQGQVGKLKAELADRAANPPPSPTATPASTNAAPSAPTVPTPDNPPASYLPAADSGTPSAPYWHRLFTISGTDSRATDPFQITSKRWRVVWHNQDKAGTAFQNTSALFINAFAKGDTIPQKVCAKLGSGGDANELVGPGGYFLKVEASGGSWEAAVEEFH